MVWSISTKNLNACKLMVTLQFEGMSLFWYEDLERLSLYIRMLKIVPLLGPSIIPGGTVWTIYNEKYIDALQSWLYNNNVTYLLIVVLKKTNFLKRFVSYLFLCWTSGILVGVFGSRFEQFKIRMRA